MKNRPIRKAGSSKPAKLPLSSIENTRNPKTYLTDEAFLELTELLESDKEIAKSFRKEMRSLKEIKRFDRLLQTRKTIYEEISIATKGDESAIEFLASIGTLCATAIWKISQHNPEAVSKSAEAVPVWPVMTSRSKTWNKHMAGYILELGLGKKSPPGYDMTRTYKNMSTSKIVAHALFLIVIKFKEQGKHSVQRRLMEKIGLDVSQIDDLRYLFDLSSQIGSAPEIMGNAILDKLTLFGMRGSFDSEIEDEFRNRSTQLPDLNLESWKQWFSLMKDIFLYLTDGHPESAEKYPLIREIGGFRKGHAGRSAKAMESEIRDGVIGAIRQAFRNQNGFSDRASPR